MIYNLPRCQRSFPVLCVRLQTGFHWTVPVYVRPSSNYGTVAFIRVGNFLGFLYDLYVVLSGSRPIVSLDDFDKSRLCTIGTRMLCALVRFRPFIVSFGILVRPFFGTACSLRIVRHLLSAKKIDTLGRLVIYPRGYVITGRITVAVKCQ